MDQTECRRAALHFRPERLRQRSTAHQRQPQSGDAPGHCPASIRIRKTKTTPSSHEPSIPLPVHHACPWPACHSFGNQIAGEFVSQESFWNELAGRAPAGWKKMNLQVVLETQRRRNHSQLAENRRSILLEVKTKVSADESKALASP